MPDPEPHRRRIAGMAPSAYLALDRSLEMTAHKSGISSPGPQWGRPARNWLDVVERYITYVQVPAWRVNAFTKTGTDTRPCMPAGEAEVLRGRMLQVVGAIARRSSTSVGECVASAEHLVELLQFQGRHVVKGDRCPKDVLDRLQRAFLLNAAGYTCTYCGRTAWGVWGEKSGTEPPRTLRFEIDHRTPRRKIASGSHANNLVVACRSCNTIKGEMTEERFFAELQSLTAAVHRKVESKTV